MIKNKLIGKIGCLLMLVWASVSLHAQSIELLGLYSNGSAGQLKAKVELAGKQIKSVTSYAYRMSDGFAMKKQQRPSSSSPSLLLRLHQEVFTWIRSLRTPVSIRLRANEAVPTMTTTLHPGRCPMNMV